MTSAQNWPKTSIFSLHCPFKLPNTFQAVSARFPLFSRSSPKSVQGMSMGVFPEQRLVIKLIVCRENDLWWKHFRAKEWVLFASLKLVRCFVPLFSLQSSLKEKWNLSERKRGQKSTRIENMSILAVHVLSLCCFWQGYFFRVFRHVINPDVTRDSLCISFSQSRPLDFDYSGFYFMTFVFD